MFTYQDLLFMGARGKIGDVMICSRNGVPFIRRAPGPRKKPPSALQQQQMEKFKLLTQFFKPLIGIFNISFEHAVKNMNCFNKAISENRNVIIGAFPDYKIDYTRVVLSMVHRPADDAVHVVSLGAGALQFSRKSQLQIPFKGKSRVFFIAAYCEEVREWRFTLYPEEKSDSSCILEAGVFLNYNVQTYIGFKTITGRPCSFYSGQLIV